MKMKFPLYLLLIDALSIHQNWVLGKLHIAPRNSSRGALQPVDISVLEAQVDFRRDIPILSVQLEIGGPGWGFQIQRQISKRNYFVGLTQYRDAKISVYRHKVQNQTSIMAVVQDMNTGFWYEITPDMEGVSIVTIIPDHDISPYSDPVFPPPATSTDMNTMQQRKPIPSLLNGVLEQSRKLLASMSPRGYNNDMSPQGYNNDMSPQGYNNDIPSQGYTNEDDDAIMNSNQGDTIIDIMVVWTQRAECIKSHLSADCEVSAISRQNMKLSILFFLQETNTVFRNSGLHLQLRLARGQRVQYEETTFSQALLDLKDHIIPMVQERRQEFKADIVMLLMDQTLDHPETGVAYNNYEHVDADFMYAVVATQYSSHRSGIYQRMKLVIYSVVRMIVGRSECVTIRIKQAMDIGIQRDAFEPSCPIPVSLDNVTTTSSIVKMMEIGSQARFNVPLFRTFPTATKIVTMTVHL